MQTPRAHKGSPPHPIHLVPALTETNPLAPSTGRLIAAHGLDWEKAQAVQQIRRRLDVVRSEAWGHYEFTRMTRRQADAVKTAPWARQWITSWRNRHLVRLYDTLATLPTQQTVALCEQIVRDPRVSAAEQRYAARVLYLTGKATIGSTPKRDQNRQVTAADSTGDRRGVDKASDWTGAERAELLQGELANFDAVIDQLRPQLELCYRHALHQVGRFGAWIRLIAIVDKRGRVTSVKAKGDGSEPPMMMNCLRTVMSHAQFAPPRTSPATLALPLTFTVPSNRALRRTAPKTPKPSALPGAPPNTP